MSLLRRKPNSIDAIEHELRSQEGRLAARRQQLEEAEQAAAAAAAERANHLANSDGADNVKLAEAARIAADNCEAMRQAVTILTKKVDEARKRLDAERDRDERGRLAAELDERAGAIEAAAADLAAALAPVAEKYAALLAAVRAHGVPYESFPGYSATAEDVCRVTLAAGLRAFAPEVLPPVSELLVPAETDVVLAARVRQVSRLRDLAREVRAGEAPAAAPANYLRGYERVLFPDTEIVIAAPISFVSVDGRRVQVPAGGITVPAPVADAARAAGIGHAPGSAGARAILAELERPPVPDYAVNARPTGVRTGPPWHDIGVDLSGTAEQKRAAS